MYEIMQRFPDSDLENHARLGNSYIEYRALKTVGALTNTVITGTLARDRRGMVGSMKLPSRTGVEPYPLALNQPRWSRPLISFRLHQLWRMWPCRPTACTDLSYRNLLRTRS